ncbi:BZ3500_MvSof-1268-A1-R1_Chr7-1g09397 [Microbotryum saponariae]|uniref:BZ3500_MvSof-1268-A1-R1_Chr7-1g09397 protein n=1 Tax=Microbotryum saponariae TaxID=289078 RepID=A0A2X0LJE7_9BASI|nr:BZ3501_MvSof-1269-A2-R1_Chr7-1g09102 [Microbotryum saponariae]SDA03363.1 BZ3500_MvSof-1268-A1-R1_Chr7-1g09397 [Microbotryum saponariae]
MSILPVSPRTHQRSFASSNSTSTVFASSSSSSDESDEQIDNVTFPRPRSPQSRRNHVSTMRKLVAASKWIQSSYSHTSKDLDFGCAGDWTGHGPENLGDRYYSSIPGAAGKRASTSSSILVPSLTHSRAHSASSDFSTVSTTDSSLPPSPTQGSCTSSPVAPYTSRVPLTPRSAHRQRQSDENAAIDAVNDYFVRVRLSQIRETVDDVSSKSPAASARGSVSALTVRAAQSSDLLEGLGIRADVPTEYLATTAAKISKSEAPKLEFGKVLRGSGGSFDLDFQLEFAYLAPEFSTYAAFHDAPYLFDDSGSLSPISSLGDSTVQVSTPPARSPGSEIDSTLEGELDELSAYFANTVQSLACDSSSAPTTYSLATSHTDLRHVASTRRRPSSVLFQATGTRSVPTSPRTRVDYAWI